MCGASGDRHIQRHQGRDKEGLIPRPPNSSPASSKLATHPPVLEARPGWGLGQGTGSRGLGLSLCLAHTEARNES